MAWKQYLLYEEQPFHLDVLMPNIAVQVFKIKHWAIIPISLFQKKQHPDKLVLFGF